MKSSSDKIIENSIKLYGFTPADKSDENEEWMINNGYLSKKPQRIRSRIRGKVIK